MTTLTLKFKRPPALHYGLSKVLNCQATICHSPGNYAMRLARKTDSRTLPQSSGTRDTAKRYSKRKEIQQNTSKSLCTWMSILNRGRVVNAFDLERPNGSDPTCFVMAYVSCWKFMAGMGQSQKNISHRQIPNEYTSAFMSYGLLSMTWRAQKNGGCASLLCEKLLFRNVRREA
jgi:hypothetical protein